jgi:MoxR-like ATPase
VRTPVPSQILSAEQLQRMQAAADEIYVDRGVIDYAVNLVFATRDPSAFSLGELAELIGFGASPRASLGLIRAGRALALLRGRTYALPQDVFDVAPEVLRHRMVLTYEALARDITSDHVLARVLSTVPAPRISPTQDPMRATYATTPTSSSEGAWRVQ